MLKYTRQVLQVTPPGMKLLGMKLYEASYDILVFIS